ncbi:MAG: carbohydrate kinase [bacterium]
MNKVYCIGETVLDIIFRDGNPIAAKPGGSMLNTAVSLGRTGLRPVFISDFGEDQAGDIIYSFLLENGVDTRFVDRFTDGNTAISLAFLDTQRNASYTFYRQFPGKRLKIGLPEAGNGDLVIFGSFYAIAHEVRKPLWKFLSRAKENGAFLIYDPNFRKPHMKQLPEFRPWILENISLARITRGSAEDFFHIFESTDSGKTYQEVRTHGCDTLIYTQNKEKVEVITGKIHLEIPVPEICPVSTIGAGDAFNAGLIYGLHALQGGLRMPDSDAEWNSLIQTAIQFAGDVCLSVENYISPEFVNKLSHA